MNTIDDALVIGGSFAGLSAAMQLARAGRRVTVVDGGAPRNRHAAASHGFFAQDGVPPFALLAAGREKLRAYPTVRFVDGQAVGAGIGPAADGHRVASVSMADGTVHASRTLLLATGVRDELPPLPGLAERWGRTVLHCPYCHGHEVRDQPLGVLWTSPMSAHHAALVSDWGPVTFFLQGQPQPDAEALAVLQRRGVAIEPTPVVALAGAAPGLEAVVLADGRRCAVAALFAGPRTRPSNDLAAQLGCDLEDGPTGPRVRTDAMKATSVPGVYAAGDVALAMHNATFASADGVMAGVAMHQSLVFG